MRLQRRNVGGRGWGETGWARDSRGRVRWQAAVPRPETESGAGWQAVDEEKGPTWAGMKGSGGPDRGKGQGRKRRLAKQPVLKGLPGKGDWNVLSAEAASVLDAKLLVIRLGRMMTPQAEGTATVRAAQPLSRRGGLQPGRLA